MASAHSAFRVLELSNPRDVETWLALWSSWPRREVFAHPGYVELFVEEKARGVCAVGEAEDGNVLYPFLLRDLTVEPFWSPDIGPAADIITPYGYGGPFYWGNGSPREAAKAFWPSFFEWAGGENVVSELVRFTLFADMLLEYPGEREEKQLNVVRGLEVDEGEIWSDFEHKVRTNIRRAQENDVQVEVDTTGTRLDDFLRIYYDTMRRRDADETYYFARTFFERIHSQLPGQFVYFCAVYNGEVVSTELDLVSAENVYAFLGGTDSNAFWVRPNEMLRYEAMRWAKEQGKRRYVLGGGYEPDDGVFRSKRSYAPGGCVPYFMGHRVFRAELYGRLVESRRASEKARGVDWSPRSGYFPEYRA